MEWISGLRDGGKAAVAGADIRRRIIYLSPGLRRSRAELTRIGIHEIFHFVWVRFANSKRAEWKDLLRDELRRGARGELGWSSEWRKKELPARFDAYACESFCDTAAWLFGIPQEHGEFTLAPRWRRRRRDLFLKWMQSPFLY